MKKYEKITVAYSATEPTQSFITSLKAAEESDLRLLLALSMHKDNENLDTASICTSLDISDAEFDASVKYWCGAGILKKIKKTETKNNTEKTHTTLSSAHAHGKLECADTAPSYSTSELNELIEKRAELANLIDSAERVMGKMFSVRDIGRIVAMVDYIGFDAEGVIAILSYAASLDKKSIAYAEKLAFSLYDEGITGGAALAERLEKMTKSRSIQSKVEAMFGMKGRALTAREKKFLSSWIDTMGFDVDAIKLAYDITVDMTGEPASAYANSILENWYKAGLRTAEEIEETLKREKATKKANDISKSKSFDTDEFFEAALKRTFEDL